MTVINDGHFFLLKTYIHPSSHVCDLCDGDRYNKLFFLRTLSAAHNKQVAAEQYIQPAYKFLLVIFDILHDAYILYRYSIQFLQQIHTN